MRDRAALPRRLAEPGYRAGFVLDHPGPVEQSDGIFDLGVEVAGAGRGAEQPRGLARILGDAAALLVERRQRILRVGIAGVGGAAQQFRGFCEIAIELLAFQIQQREIVGGGDVPELRRAFEQCRRRIPVARPAARGEAQHGEFEHRLAVPPIDRQREPRQCLLVVLGNPEPIGVELTQERHRFRVALVVDPARGFGERGQVLAAVVGRIGEVRLGCAAPRGRIG